METTVHRKGFDHAAGSNGFLLIMLDFAAPPPAAGYFKIIIPLCFSLLFERSDPCGRSRLMGIMQCVGYRPETNERLCWCGDDFIFYAPGPSVSVLGFSKAPYTSIVISKDRFEVIRAKALYLSLLVHPCIRLERCSI